MKILLVNKYWYHRGGTERVVFLTKQLLEQAGHRVELFGMHHPANEINNKYFVDYVDVHQLHLKQKLRAAKNTLYHAEAKQQFSDLVDAFQPDVVHLHNIYHQLSFSLLDVTKKRGIRTVMTLHDYHLLSPNYTLFHHGKIDEHTIGKNAYRCILYNAMESFPISVLATIEFYYRQIKKYHTAVDYYIAPSQFMKDMCVRAGWKEERIRVIPNPIDTTDYTPSKTAGSFVTYIGRISKEKGVNILLQAAKQTPQIPYRIIGDGKEKQLLEQYVKKEGMTNVQWYSWQQGDALRRLMNEARIVVAPSLWYENCPLSILEAMSLGKVVIGSNLGGITELLPPELVVPPGDPTALAATISLWYSRSSKERQQIGKQLRQQVEKHHTFAAYQQALLQVYTL